MLAILAASCSSAGGPKLDPGLTGQIPAHWTAARIQVPDAAATGWLADFDSPALAELAKAAVEHNHDLAAAAARVEQARARVRVAGADRWPQADASLSAARSKNLRGAAFESVTANNFNLSLDVSWEADLWGRLASLRRAALADLDASGADYRAARLSLAATTAKTALEIAAARRQIRLAEETLASLESNLAILDRKLEAGAADDRTALDISLTRADIARARAGIARQEGEIDAARRLLETLLGRYPSGALDTLEDLPRVKRPVPAGLPSELLLRRPDLVAAESRVDARVARTDAARKALLPAIRLTGGGGTSTTQEFSDLLSLDNLVWNIGANLAQPVLQGGRLRAEVALSEAERDEIASLYAETALAAFREVETGLAAERHFQRQEAALEEAAAESLRAERLSISQYESGLVDIITLLESQRRSFDARSALLDVRLQRLLNRVDLYLALGGDFEAAPRLAPPPEAAAPAPPPASSAPRQRRR